MNVFSVNNLRDDQLINTRNRLEFQKKSFFYRHTHCVEKLVVDYEFYTEILSYFDRTFQINDLQHTARVYDFVLRTHKIKWSKEGELTGKGFKKIYNAFQKTVLCSGAGVKCSIRSTRDYLLAKTQEMSFSSLRWESWRRVLFKKDEVRLAKFRIKLERALQEGLEAFNSGEVPEEVFQGFVFNVLSFLPFTYPSEGISFNVPVKMNGSWAMASYSVDKKFSLSPSWLSSPLPVYGLVSANPAAHPILTSLGTTYPAGEGFMATILADCTPGFSVGEAASLYGREEIEEWLEGKSDVRATGISLGGSISLHFSRLHPEKISQVYAFNPAGAYSCNWKGFDHSNIDYYIYSNENDLVSTMGKFPEGENVHFYRVMTRECENFLAAHTKNFYAAERVTMIRTSAEYENERIERKILTILHMVFAPLLFFALLPIQLVYRLFEFLSQQISNLCYDDSSENQEVEDGEFFGSGSEHDPTSVSASAVQA